MRDAELHWCEATGIGRVEFKIKRYLDRAPMTSNRRGTTHFALCLRNDGYAASLEPRKLYEVMSDPEAATLGQVRVIDESGEDYLYPQGYFAEIRLPAPVERALRRPV